MRPSRRELANAIRALSMDAVQKAGSGHPGAPMGMAGIAEVLWNDYLIHNPANPLWVDRDRFVLSNGHASMLLYSAVAIGTSHGAYKFSRPPTGDILAVERVKQIHRRLPDTHLVMHGSSSVPQDWLEIINNYGGDLGRTYGVPVEEIQEGIKHGVRKVNIDTDLRLASTSAVRKFLVENPKEFDPRKFLRVATQAMKQICKARYETFGCAGQASHIRPLTLESMSRRYQAGELKPRVH
jgi:hypothetical protein